MCGEEAQIILGDVLQIALFRLGSQKPSPGSALMDVNDTRRGIHVKLSLAESEHDLDRAEVFLVQCYVLLEFTSAQ